MLELRIGSWQSPAKQNPNRIRAAGGNKKRMSNLVQPSVQRTFSQRNLQPQFLLEANGAAWCSSFTVLTRLSASMSRHGVWQTPRSGTSGTCALEAETAASTSILSSSFCAVAVFVFSGRMLCETLSMADVADACGRRLVLKPPYSQTSLCISFRCSLL